MRKYVMFIALLAMVAFVFADVQITSYSVVPSTLKPGVSGSVAITVYNPSSSTVTGVVIYQAAEQFTLTSNRLQLGDLGPLGSTVVAIPFTIKSDTAPGIYNMELDAFWTENSNTLTKAFSIPINVTNPPSFHFSFTPLDQVTPGESFVVDGQIQNSGGSISQMVVTVNSGSFFLNGISQLSLGDLQTGGNVSFQIPLVASASVGSGVQSIPLTMTYQDPQGALQQTTISISPVQVARSSVDFIVDAQPEKMPVSPGDMVNFPVNLTNTGNSKAYSAKISISSTSNYFTTLGSSEKYFASIDPGSKEQMQFELGVSGSAPAGYYPVTLMVQYLDVNGVAQTPIQKQVGVQVGDVPQILITPSTSPSPVAAGGVYIISLQFSNTGTINIRALSVNASSESFEILSPTQNYIGSLNLDDYSSVDYTVYANNNLKPGAYPIHVTMAFRDAYNTEHIVTQDVPITIVPQSIAGLTEKSAGISLTSLLIILILICVIVYFAYTRYFKKKGK